MTRATREIDGVTWTRSHGGTWRDPEGYDAEGRDAWGRNRAGFARSGWNAEGIHESTGTIYDPEGFTKSGRDAEGMTRKARAKLEAEQGVGEAAAQQSVEPVEPRMERPAPQGARIVEITANGEQVVTHLDRRYVTENAARAWMLGSLLRVSHRSTTREFTMSRLLPQWLETFRDDVRSERDQQAYRLWIACRADLDRLVEEGLIEEVGSRYRLTEEGFFAMVDAYDVARMFRDGSSGRTA